MNKSITIVLLLLLLGCKAEENTIKSSKTPLMGWASWNNYRVNINENIIKSQADAMAS